MGTGHGNDSCMGGDEVVTPIVTSAKREKCLRKRLRKRVEKKESEKNSETALFFLFSFCF